MRVRREVIEARAKALLGEIISGMDDPPSIEAGVEAALASSAFVLMVVAKDRAPLCDPFDAIMSGAVNLARQQKLSKEELIERLSEAVTRKFAALEAKAGEVKQ